MCSDYIHAQFKSFDIINFIILRVQFQSCSGVILELIKIIFI